MCIGVPLRILSVDGIAARATDGATESLIDLSLTGPLAPGTWVLSFLGTAREAISEDEARLISDALRGLGAIMAGEEMGDAFADLDARTPTLPPHLQVAVENGDTHG